MIAGVTLLLTTQSCSSDDDYEPSEYATSIIGIWERQKLEGVEDGHHFVEDYANDPKYKDSKEYYIFEADSKVFYARSYDSGLKKTREGIWKISETDPSKLIMDWSDIYMTRTNILSCSKKTLELTDTAYWGYHISTYKRIKSLKGYPFNDKD